MIDLILKVLLSFDGSGNASSFTGNKDFMFGRTPYIQSQLVNGTRYDLFRIYTRSHGTDVNAKYKIRIVDVKPDTDVAGSDYGMFSMQVVEHSTETVLQEFARLTLDPDSPDYFAKRIGDKWTEIDSNGKLSTYGDYPNLSMYISCW